MLAGRYADSRVRELAPRISIDRVENRVKARRGAQRLIYLSGGTIPDRGYFHLRHVDSLAKLGELDEEFVWERSLGDTFALGAQSWRVRRITYNDVLVSPSPKAAAMAPFWRAEERDRSYHLSSRIGEFLEKAEELLKRPEGRSEVSQLLESKHAMEPEAANVLVELLERQAAAGGGQLPHRHRVLIEEIHDEGAAPDQRHYLVHNFWGGKLNRPFALALRAAWEADGTTPFEIESANDCLLLSLPTELDLDRLLQLVRPDNIEDLLHRDLASTGFFGARFRESAGRALLLPRGSFRRRVPLWLNRKRAKKLFAAVADYEDFPILMETWRTSLHDEFDLESLKRVLTELATGETRVESVRSASPSPFAANLLWKRTNRLMYEDDAPDEGPGAGVRPDLLQELVYSSPLRPRLPEGLLTEFQRKLHRTHSGYAPRSADELVDHVQERILIPDAEWRDLLAAIERDGIEEDVPLDALLEGLGPRLVRVELPGSRTTSGSTGAPVCALQTVPRLLGALGAGRQAVHLEAISGLSAPNLDAALERLSRVPFTGDSAEDGNEALTALLGEWLRFYGPIAETELAETFVLAESVAAEAIESLLEDRSIVVDRFRDLVPSPLEICDAANLERLLRMLRSAARPRFEARPLTELPAFLAAQQGLTAGPARDASLKEAMEKLFGYPAPADAWEGELLPARLDPYYPAWLDGLMQESDLTWLGCGQERLTFALAPDLDLFPTQSTEPGRTEVLPPGAGRFTFAELLADSATGPSELSDALWRAAWAGEVSNSTFLAVRKGILSRFQVDAAMGRERQRRPSRRLRFDRWQATTPLAGSWFRLRDGEDEEPYDALEQEELNKERARVLLDRYGVLFRELLQRELPDLAWGRLFRSLRLMELSGEVLSGHFFEGVPGLQFASPAAFRRLREGLPTDAICWMSAIDPAAPTGLGLEPLRGIYPDRRPGSHLVFHGARLVMTSWRNGSRLEFAVAAESPFVPEYCSVLKHLLTRQVQPVKAIDVETINAKPAVETPYAAVLATLFSATREGGGVLRLRRKY